MKFQGWTPAPAPAPGEPKHHPSTIPNASRSCLLCSRWLHGCQTPRCQHGEAWLVCGYGNSSASFETGMSCTVLPTEWGELLRNAKISLFSKRSRMGLSLSFSSQPSACTLWLRSASSLRSTGTWRALRRHTLNNHPTVTHALPKAVWLLAHQARKAVIFGGRENPAASRHMAQFLARRWEGWKCF